MKKLDDIVLKMGDIVYYEDSPSIIYRGDGEHKKVRNCLAMTEHIVKIERPIKYETIYEAPKSILDKEEKEYLEAVIRPFKDNVLNITKVGSLRLSFIQILYKDFEDDSTLNLPHFQSGSMYKGMELNKEYTLEELGLFEE